MGPWALLNWLSSRIRLTNLKRENGLSQLISKKPEIFLRNRAITLHIISQSTIEIWSNFKTEMIRCLMILILSIYNHKKLLVYHYFWFTISLTLFISIRSKGLLKFSKLTLVRKHVKNCHLRLIPCIHASIKFKFVIIYYLFITLMPSLPRFMISMWALNRKVFAKTFLSILLTFNRTQFRPFRWNLIKRIICLMKLLIESFKEWINILSGLLWKSSLTSIWVLTIKESLNLTLWNLTFL